MCEILSAKEQEALHEMLSLICQIIVLLHKVLDIEQRLGFLNDAQHKKIFSDANIYDDIRAELIIRNKKQSSLKKASENSIDVDNEILDYIANYTSDNIRELEGVINHLSMSLMQGKQITLNLAKEALKHYQKSDIREVNSNIIIDSVSRYFNLSVEDMWNIIQIGTKYIELIVLSFIGYKGEYSNRLKERWFGEVEVVPWNNTNN